MNEEFSGFHSETLRDQAEYVNDAITFILNHCYKSLPEDRRPRSIVLMGHSMGGIIARLLFMLPNYRAGSVEEIFTFATAHTSPPILIEYDLYKLYQEVNTFWKQSFDSTQNPLVNVSIISISGGNHDYKVPGYLSSLNEIVPETNSLSLFSTGITDVWVPADHECIVWCNQLVKKLADVLHKAFDAPLSNRMKLFRKLFTNEEILEPQNSSIPADKVKFVQDLDIPLITGETVENLLFRFDSVRSDGELFIMSKSDLSMGNILTCKSVTQNGNNACSTVPEVQKEIVPLNQFDKDLRSKVYLLRLNLSSLRTDAGRIILVTSDQPSLIQFIPNEYPIAVVPLTFELLLGGYEISLDTERHRIQKKLRLDLQHSSYIGYTLKTQFVCDNNIPYNLVLKQKSKLLNEIKYWTNPTEIPLDHAVTSENESFYLEFFASPECQPSSISLKLDWILTVFKVLRRNTTSLLCLPFVFTILNLFTKSDAKLFLYGGAVLLAAEIVRKSYMGTFVDPALPSLVLLIFSFSMYKFTRSLLWSVCQIIAGIQMSRFSATSKNLILCLSIIIMVFFPPEMVFFLSLTIQLAKVNPRNSNFNYQLFLLTLYSLNSPLHIFGLLVWIKNMSKGWRYLHAQNPISNIVYLVFVLFDSGDRPRVPYEGLYLFIASLATTVFGIDYPWLLPYLTQSILLIILVSRRFATQRPEQDKQE